MAVLADVMMGGAGNDTYVVDSVGDIVIETIGAGADIVSHISAYTLGTQLENPTYYGTGAPMVQVTTWINVIYAGVGNMYY